MTINIPGNGSIAPSSTPETAVPSSRVGTHGTSAKPTGFGDQITVSSSTTNIQSALDDVAVSRSAKVAKLAQLYSSGRYSPDSTTAASAMVSDASSGPTEV